MTFRDPESAKRACVDPAPVIDGRRANCNLASLGQTRPAPTFGNFILSWFQVYLSYSVWFQVYLS